MKPELIQSPHRPPPATGLSRDELDRYLRRARCLRAAAFNRALKSAARRLGGLIRALHESRDRRRAVAELRRLDPRTLKDIGIERSQIPFIVEQLVARRKADGDPRKVYPLHTLTASSPPAAEPEDDERCPPLAA